MSERGWRFLAIHCFLVAACGSRSGIQQDMLENKGGSSSELATGARSLATGRTTSTPQAGGTTGAGTPIDADPNCGNGKLDPGEDCDDRNRLDGDGCDATCRYGPDRLKDCGNGRIDPREQCDDANTLPGDGCNGICCVEPNFDCPSAMRPDCRCGNGMVESGERCDDGNNRSGDGCTLRCLLENKTCGNGIIDAVEQCDDANHFDGDGCDGDCRYETCRINVICGNGVFEAGEVCDDGNLVDGDGCDSLCRYDGG